MLFETYAEKGLICQKNVYGATPTGAFAFRGDLVVELGDLHENAKTRNPPKQILVQATTLVKNDKIVFLSGLLDRVEQIETLLEGYGDDIADDANILLYVVNAETAMKTDVAGKTIIIQPFDEGMVWNLLIDDFYVEKSDLKGQSGEEKVETIADAFGEFSGKLDEMAFDAALANTNNTVRQARGPV